MISEFKESQQFRQWWLWLLLSPMIVIAIVLVVKQLILGQPVGTHPLSDIGVYIFLVFIVALVALFFYLRLDTTINKSGVFMTYRPFLKKHYSWDAIDRTKIINYGFVGYGFRISKHGWIYNVKGNKGLKVFLKKGTHFTIGTQQPEALEMYLKKL